jgi:X-Pro dipeptidyl-peptidase
VAPHRDHERMARHWAARGYAVSIAHIRGTGKSGGCVDMGGVREQADMAELVDWAGRRAEWSTGKVGMYGASWMGMAQLEAAMSEDRKKTRYLKAIIPVAPVTSSYANYGYDGVMDSIATPASPTIMLAYAFPRAEALDSDDLAGDVTDIFDRPACHGEHLRGTGDLSGNFNAWYREREHRSRVERIGAATLARLAP